MIINKSFFTSSMNETWKHGYWHIKSKNIFNLEHLDMGTGELSHENGKCFHRTWEPIFFSVFGV